MTDAATGNLVYARCLVNGALGKDGCTVEGQKPFPVGGGWWYVIPGTLRLDVPTGETTLLIERGLEYEPIRDAFEVNSGETVVRSYELRRWINMAERGWRSGEMHIHYPPEVVHDQILAADLNVGTCLVAWVAEGDERSDSPEIDPIRRIDQDYVYSINDEEIERFPITEYGGPVYLLGLRKQIHLDAPTPSYPTNIEYMRLARDQGGVVALHSACFYDAPVAAALGMVDAVGVACNFFGYDYTMKRVKHYGNADDLQLYGHTPWGTANMIFGKYYRLLNCGFRLPVSAGSAAPVKPNPVGGNRLYVKMDGALSYEKYFEGLKAGRSFATNGPMLFFEADGTGPGEEIQLDEPGAIQARVEAIFNKPLGKLEVVFNGDVIKTVEASEGEDSIREELELPIAGSGWIIARVFWAEDYPIKFAHTSPIYVTVPGHPLDSSEDAAYYARWIQHRIEWNKTDKGFRQEEHRLEVEKQLRKALAVFEGVI